MSRDFQHFWGGKNSTSGPHMHRQTRFRDMFRFREDVRKKRVSANLLSKKNGRKSCGTVPLRKCSRRDLITCSCNIVLIIQKTLTTRTLIHIAQCTWYFFTFVTKLTKMKRLTTCYTKLVYSLFKHKFVVHINHVFLSY